MTRFLARVEARYVRWLRLGLHLVAAGAFALILVGGALFAASLVSWIGTGKSANLELPLVGGTAGLLIGIEFWVGAVMLLLSLRVLVALDRRHDGAAWMLAGDGAVSEDISEEPRRWYDY
jgi:hypothetical protein